MNAVGVFSLAGGLAYVGNVKEQKSAFPSNTPRIIIGTALLAFGASLVTGRWTKPVTWVAVLMLISVAVRYVPSFSTTTPVKVKGSK
jgi:uncharacterized membrane protein YphA (DoxX/SURF4 family)